MAERSVINLVNMCRPSLSYVSKVKVTHLVFLRENYTHRNTTKE